MPKNLALFPMTRDMCAVARYASLLRGFTLSHLFIPAYTRMEGSDVSQLDGGDCLSLKLVYYSKDRLSGCDVLFVDYDENLADLSLCKEVIADAKEMGKEVVCSHVVEHMLRETALTWPIDPPKEEQPGTDCLYPIQIPVVTVLSQGERTDQFAVELVLNKYFTEEGYNVSQISSLKVGGMFGFHNMPGFLYEPMDVYQKILEFNRYVKKLIEKEQPHLLVMGVPGGIMKYSDKLLKGMGVLPFIICNAVRSDLHVLSMYYSEYSRTYFDEMSMYGSYRLGSPIQFFNVANSCLDANASSETLKIDYVDLESNFVLNSLQRIEAGENHIFNVLNHESSKNACVAIKEALIGNVRYVS